MSDIPERRQSRSPTPKDPWEYELPGSGQWLSENPTTHGASGVGTRAVRHAKKKRERKRPSWMTVAVLLGLVLVTLVGLLLYQDTRRAMGEHNHDERDRSVSTLPAHTRVVGESPSPDTIKRKLQAKGFKVDYLATVADQRNLAYDVAETHIDGTPALILAFKDAKTRAKWVEGSDVPVIYHNAWAVSVPDQNLAGRMAQKLGVDLHG